MIACVGVPGHRQIIVGTWLALPKRAASACLRSYMPTTRTCAPYGNVNALAEVAAGEAAAGALTAGLFSRSPARIRRAAEELRAGNLYVNRAITGALVGCQPFGGYGLSGVGSKAGGPDYLMQFVEPRVVTENTLRQGFAPPDE